MLKIALIGYGYWGSKLARNFQNLEAFKLISIADIMSKNLSLAKLNDPLFFLDILIDFRIKWV